MIAFYGMSHTFFTVSERKNLFALIISFIATIFFLSPSLSANEVKKEIERKKRIDLIDREWQAGEYHNDFSRVGSADDPKPIKPIDYSGDAIASGRETIKEELEQIIKSGKDHK